MVSYVVGALVVVIVMHVLLFVLHVLACAGGDLVAID